MRLASILTLTVLASGCASIEPPQQVDDACTIFAERPAWWRAAKRAEDRWGTSPALQLAIIRQESSFTHNARPPREDGFLFFRGRRPSSAYGYAQALDGTWEEYQRAAGVSGADRDEFRDATDFVAWYVSVSRSRLNLGPDDYRDHYLAYHEGHGGFARGTFRQKSWLLEVATRVNTTAQTYDLQLERCESRLNRRFSLF